jgi:hypothetical protein
MAWITNDDGQRFGALPQEPDMETLTYWATRLEPVIRAEEGDEVIVVFCNRCGQEDELTYAGTSAVIGIKGGEVSVYGLLGRGKKELLVVDTDSPPFAKMVLMPEGETLSDAIESEAVESSDSTYPATSSDELTIESEHLSSLDDNPESFYTKQLSKPVSGKVASAKSASAKSASAKSASAKSASAKSASAQSSSSAEAETRTSRKPKHVPPKLQIPEGMGKWRKDKSDQHLELEVPVADIPTPSGPSPTPFTGRPKLGLPISRWAAGQAENLVVSPESSTSSRLYSAMPDSGVAVSPSGATDGRPASRHSRKRAPSHGDETARKSLNSSSHRRVKSKSSEVSRTGKRQEARSPDKAVSSPTQDHEICSTSFTRSRHEDRTRYFKDSPPVCRPDDSILSVWLDALPQETGDSGYGDMPPNHLPPSITSPAQRSEPAPDNRFSTQSRDSIVIAASPSVFQTTFPQNMDSILMNHESPSHNSPILYGGEWPIPPTNRSSPALPLSQETRLAAMDARMENEEQPTYEKLGVTEFADKINAARTPCIILSPIQSPQRSPSKADDGLPQPPGSESRQHWATSPKETRHGVERRESGQAGKEQAIVDYINAELQSVLSGNHHGEKLPDVPHIPRVSSFPAHRTRPAPHRMQNHQQLHAVIPSDEELRIMMGRPDPSPASFTSSVDTMSPSNEVPVTPLDVTGPMFGHEPPTPRAMAAADVDLSDIDEALNNTPLSPVGQVQLPRVPWFGKNPQILMNRGLSVTW